MVSGGGCLLVLAFIAAIPVALVTLLVALL
jgi:hypothetical protein